MRGMCLIVMGLGVVALLTAPASANLLDNGGFEVETQYKDGDVPSGMEWRFLSKAHDIASEIEWDSGSSGSHNSLLFDYDEADPNEAYEGDQALYMYAYSSSPESAIVRAYQDLDYAPVAPGEILQITFYARVTLIDAPALPIIVSSPSDLVVFFADGDTTNVSNWYYGLRMDETISASSFSSSWQQFTVNFENNTTETIHTTGSNRFVGFEFDGPVGEAHGILLDSVEASVIPEPATLCVLGLGAVLFFRKRR